VLLVSLAVIAATWLLSRIPFIAAQAKIIRIVAIALLLGAVYFKGSLENEMVWRARVAELEEKIRVAEAKSQKVNTVIKNKIITKTKVVHDTQVVVREKIKEVEKVINEKCELDPAVIEIHNHAAETPGDKQ
jgi:hypothetical protein